MAPLVGSAFAEAQARAWALLQRGLLPRMREVAPPALAPPRQVRASSFRDHWGPCRWWTSQGVLLAICHRRRRENFRFGAEGGSAGRRWHWPQLLLGPASRRLALRRARPRRRVVSAISMSTRALPTCTVSHREVKVLHDPVVAA